MKNFKFLILGLIFFGVFFGIGEAKAEDTVESCECGLFVQGEPTTVVSCTYNTNFFNIESEKTDIARYDFGQNVINKLISYSENSCNSRPFSNTDDLKNHNFGNSCNFSKTGTLAILGGLNTAVSAGSEGEGSFKIECSDNSDQTRCECKVSVATKTIFPSCESRQTIIINTGERKTGNELVQEIARMSNVACSNPNQPIFDQDFSGIEVSPQTDCNISSSAIMVQTSQSPRGTYQINCYSNFKTQVPTSPTVKPTDNITAPPSAQSLNKLGTNLPDLIGRVIKTIMGVVGTIALIIFIYAGILWMTAHGNSEREKKAMDTIVWASIGILVILSSYALVDFILGAII